MYLNHFSLCRSQKDLLNYEREKLMKKLIEAEMDGQAAAQQVSHQFLNIINIVISKYQHIWLFLFAGSYISLALYLSLLSLSLSLSLLPGSWPKRADASPERRDAAVYCWTSQAGQTEGSLYWVYVWFWGKTRFKKNVFSELPFYLDCLFVCLWSPSLGC